MRLNFLIWDIRSRVIQRLQHFASEPGVVALTAREESKWQSAFIGGSGEQDTNRV